MSDATKNCPVCGEEILAVARKCRYCGEYLDPTARPQDPAPSSLDRALLPVGRPASAIISGYCALVAFFPLIGFITAPVAVITGIVALKQINADSSLSGRGRAWFGIIVGGLLTVLYVGLLVVFVIGAVSRQNQFR